MAQREDEGGWREVAGRADAAAARMSGEDDSFAAMSQRLGTDYQDLLHAIARWHPRCAFDRHGRPGAIAAVREALPVVERELFDAILDDHACEVAAIEEALYQIALAYGRRCRSGA